MVKNYNLFSTIIDNSISDIWEYAVLEWDIVGFEEDRRSQSRCICGKENIKYLYDIKNVHNNKSLTPIGSSCIKKFEVKELKDKINVYEKLFKLLNHYEDNKYIHFKDDKKLFSRNLINYLAEQEVLKTEEYNGKLINYHKALLTFYNARTLTNKQSSFATAIVINKVIPYLEQELKIRNSD